MKIFRCVKTNKISQKFGLKGTSAVMLHKYQQICRSSTDCLIAHNGWDFAEEYGKKVYWDCDIKGKVIKTQIDNKLGWGITVITEDRDGVFQHRFWHLNAIFVKPGDTLDSGRVIGFNDTTGWATGPHVHRDIKPMVYQGGALVAQYNNNGFFGAVDLEPYYVDKFIVDHMNELKAKINCLKQMIQKILEILKGR